jgi:hypothetical protein
MVTGLGKSAVKARNKKAFMNQYSVYRFQRCVAGCFASLTRGVEAVTGQELPNGLCRLPFCRKGHPAVLQIARPGHGNGLTLMGDGGAWTGAEKKLFTP